MSYMNFLKNVINNILHGALISVPLLIFIHFTHGYFSQYSPIPSILYFFSSMSFGVVYLAITLYITRNAGKLFYKKLELIKLLDWERLHRLHQDQIFFRLL